MYNDDALIVAICSNIRQSNKMLQKYYLREKQWIRNRKLILEVNASVCLS